MGDRLKKEPAKEMVDSYISEHLMGEKKDFAFQMQLHKAHVVMLCERKILQQEDAVVILKTLCDIEAEGIDALQLDKNLGDLYMNIEALIIKRTGSHIGGRMHTGRSRNEMESCLLRMALRSGINRLMEKINAVLSVLLEKASIHLGTVMPGFTHSQPAQPITFGHYCMANASALLRDMERLAEAYGRVNESPMGSGALAGTGFPVDQERVAAFLGFTCIAENSLDAVSSLDFAVEIAAHLAIMMSTLSRLAMDLILWGSWNYRLIEFDDSFSSISSIMPQKKNNVSAETIRANSAMVYGDLISALGVLRSLPWGMHRDLSFIDKCSLSAVKRSEGMLSLLKGILQTLEIRESDMLSSASSGYSTATDLADLLVRRKNFSFRVAYKIVGAIVNDAIEKDLKIDELSVHQIDVVATAVTGEPLDLSAAELKQVLDPVNAVQVRQGCGGPAPSSVKEAITRAQSRREGFQKQIAERRLHLQQAEELLAENVAAIIR